MHSANCFRGGSRLAAVASRAESESGAEVRLGYAVATRDRRSFARIEGLDVEYW